MLRRVHELISLMLNPCCNLDMPAANHANTDIYQPYLPMLLAPSMVLYVYTPRLMMLATVSYRFRETYSLISFNCTSRKMLSYMLLTS